MRRITLEESPSVRTNRYRERLVVIASFRDGYGYSDFAIGDFHGSCASSQECPWREGALYLSEVDQILKVKTWECTEADWLYTDDLPLRHLAGQASLVP